MTIQIKRVYDTPVSEDGYRVLVDRLWPRGLSKERAAVKEWLKETAPSTGLRQWFGHNPIRWLEFKHRYMTELKAPAAQNSVEHLRFLASKGKVTLLYAAKDEICNNAEILREYLMKTKEGGL